MLNIKPSRKSAIHNESNKNEKTLGERFTEASISFMTAKKSDDANATNNVTGVKLINEVKLRCVTVIIA